MFEIFDNMTLGFFLTVMEYLYLQKALLNISLSSLLNGKKYYTYNFIIYLLKQKNNRNTNLS